MKIFASIALLCLLHGGSWGAAQDSYNPVSVIQLIAMPEKFDRQLVTVWGYLRIDHEPKHGVTCVLYLHREDADNLLAGNAIFVEPSAQMLRDEEKINRMYVSLTGSFRAVRAEGGGYSSMLKNVHNFAVWSDPERPIGSKAAAQKPK